MALILTSHTLDQVMHWTHRSYERYLISPVKAPPLPFQQFWAATWKSVRSILFTKGMNTNGGEMIVSALAYVTVNLCHYKITIYWELQLNTRWTKSENLVGQVELNLVPKFGVAWEEINYRYDLDKELLHCLAYSIFSSPHQRFHSVTIGHINHHNGVRTITKRIHTSITFTANIHSWLILKILTTEDTKIHEYSAHNGKNEVYHQ